MHARTRKTPIARWLVIALALLLLLPAIVQSAAAQGPVPGDRMDLPGVTVTPLGLHALGITGFGTDRSTMYHAADEVLSDHQPIASRGDMLAADVPGIEQVLTTSGWLQFHEQLHGKPVDAGSNLLSERYAIGIEQYATPDGAAAGFAAFTNEATIGTATTAVTHEVFQPATSFGDETVAWRSEGNRGDRSLEKQSVTLMVRVDTFIVSVTQTVYRGGPPPDEAAVGRVMLRQLDDIAANQASGTTPGCLSGAGGGLCVQRIYGHFIDSNVASYDVRAGIAMPGITTTPEELLQWQADVAEYGIISSYTHTVDVAQGSAYVVHRVITLPDAAGAARYHEHLFGPEAVDAPQTAITVPGATTAATFAMTSSSGGSHWTNSYAVVDNVVVWVNVSDTTGPVPDITEELLISQVACIQAGECLTPVQVDYNRFR